MIHIKHGTANAEVELQLPGGECIVRTLTSDRVLTLRLRVGGAAFALVSPASVIVTRDRTDGLSFPRAINLPDQSSSCARVWRIPT